MHVMEIYARLRINGDECRTMTTEEVEMDIEEMKEVERIMEAVVKATIASVMAEGLNKPKSLLSPEEAAAILGNKVQTLSVWRTRSTGPNFCKIGSSVMYRPEDLDLYISEQLVKH
jgi:hypothetical protein